MQPSEGGKEHRRPGAGCPATALVQEAKQAAVPASARRCRQPAPSRADHRLLPPALQRPAGGRNYPEPRVGASSFTNTKGKTEGSECPGGGESSRGCAAVPAASNPPGNNCR